MVATVDVDELNSDRWIVKPELFVEVVVTEGLEVDNDLLVPVVDYETWDDVVAFVLKSTLQNEFQPRPIVVRVVLVENFQDPIDVLQRKQDCDIGNHNQSLSGRLSDLTICFVFVANPSAENLNLTC